MTTYAAGVHALARRDIFIAYGDTDAAGIIYYASWFRWMERMHTEWLFGHGVRFPELFDLCGASVVTRSTSCEYLAIVRPYDLVTMSMALEYRGQHSYRLGFTMIQPDGRLVARSTLHMVGVDRTGVKTAVPEPIDAALAAGPLTETSRK